MIPKIIFQSWKTRELKGQMAKNSEQIQKLNPNYKYMLYDDNDCRKLLLDNFGVNYANAFDTLIPGAFKCDFWRYAALYLYGGVYMDMDMELLVPLDDFIEPNDTLISVKDLRHFFVPHCNIYQAFIAVVPKHPVLLYALQISFSNIVTRRSELFDNLSITGPVIFGISINLYWNEKETQKGIEAGKYPDGTKILNFIGDYTCDLNKKRLIKNKFEGYDRGSLDYAHAPNFTYEPRKKRKHVILSIFIGLILIAIIVGIIMFAYRWKFKKCVRECSVSPSPVSFSS